MAGFLVKHTWFLQAKLTHSLRSKGTGVAWGIATWKFFKLDDLSTIKPSQAQLDQLGQEEGLAMIEDHAFPSLLELPQQALSLSTQATFACVDSHLVAAKKTSLTFLEVLDMKKTQLSLSEELMAE